MAHTTTSTTNFIRRPNLDFKKNLRRICKTRKNTKVHSSTATQGNGGYPNHRDEATDWSCPKKNNRETLNGNNSNC